MTHCPLIKIVPIPLSEPSLKESLIKFDSYTHVVITSKSTISILLNYLSQLGCNHTVWSNKQVVAVGKITALHLEERGITPFKIASDETAEGVIQVLKQLPLKDAHLFWPHSAQARKVITQYLEKEEILHTAVALYHSKENPPADCPSLESFDEIIFTSPSIVKAFFTIFGKFPLRPKLIPIGPVTAAALNDFIQKAY